MEIIFKLISKILAKRNIYLTKSLSGRYKQQILESNFDYIRASTLELCYNEIERKKLYGSVAELGVYRGAFAQKLNILFSNRKLYLFDTFEGFNNVDITVDKLNNYSLGNQDFSDTSIEKVKEKMLYPENCIFKKGFFPETVMGTDAIEDDFCFVSIDTDLYAPIYEGLTFFYPRLVQGGYIFIHDFNNRFYKGAREGVMTYCREHSINYVPIADDWGTVIITK